MPDARPASAMLALLDVGPTEFLMLAGLFLALFGVDKIPEWSRGLGRAAAQFKAAGRQFEEQIARERGEAPEAFRPGDAVPPEQRAQVEAAEEAALQRLRDAARALGIDPQGKDEAALRSAIADRVGRAG